MRKSIILKVAFLVFVSTMFFSANTNYSISFINGIDKKTTMEKENDDKTINFYDGDVLISSFKTQKYKDKNVIIIKCKPEPKSDKMFVGWVRDNDDVVYKNGMLIAVKNDIDFHAKYEIVDMDEILKKYLDKDVEEKNKKEDETGINAEIEDDIEKKIDEKENAEGQPCISTFSNVE